jgi:bacteriocin-like protein
MNKNNLITQVTDYANSIAGQDVSDELTELSDKDLQQIAGGIVPEYKMTLPDGTVIVVSW